jgi:WD40 repeat protein
MHLCRLKGHEDTVSSVCFARFRGEAALISGSHDGTVRIWSVSRSECLAVLSISDLEGKAGAVQSVSAGAEVVLAGTASGNVAVWAGRNRDAKLLRGKSGSIHGLDITNIHGRPLVAAAGHGGGVLLWDVDTASLVAELPTTESVHDVAFGNGGALYVATGACVCRFDINAVGTQCHPC